MAAGASMRSDLFVAHDWVSAILDSICPIAEAPASPSGGPGSQEEEDSPEDAQLDEGNGLASATPMFDVPSTPIALPSPMFDVPSTPIALPSPMFEVPSTPIALPSPMLEEPSTPMATPMVEMESPVLRARASPLLSPAAPAGCEESRSSADHGEDLWGEPKIEAWGEDSSFVPSNAWHFDLRSAVTLPSRAHKAAAGMLSSERS